MIINKKDSEIIIQYFTDFIAYFDEADKGELKYSFQDNDNKIHYSILSLCIDNISIEDNGSFGLSAVIQLK